jgi:hypothetical protein
MAAAAPDRGAVQRQQVIDPVRPIVDPNARRRVSGTLRARRRRRVPRRPTARAISHRVRPTGLPDYGDLRALYPGRVAVPECHSPIWSAQG